MFLVLARRSLTVHAAVLGGALALYDLLANKSWAGNWQGGVQEATMTLVWSLPGIVLAAGLDGRRYLRSREVSPTSAVRPVRAFTTALAASAACPALVMVMLILTTGAVNADVSRFHFPGLLPLALPFVFIAGYVAWGFLCGRYLDVLLLVPVAAVTGYLAPVLLAYFPDVRRALLSPIDNAPSAPPLFLRSEAVLAQIGVGTAIVVGIMAILLVDGRKSGRTWWPQAAVAVTTVAVMATIVGVVDPRRHYEATNARGPSACRSTQTLTVCVWPDHSPLLTPVLRAGTQLAGAIGDSWAARPTGLIENGLRVPDGWAPFGTGTTFAHEADVAASLAAVMVASLACGPGSRTPDLTSDVSDREQWLLTSAGYLPLKYSSERVQRIHAKPVELQRAWWVDAPEGAFTCH